MRVGREMRAAGLRAWHGHAMRLQSASTMSQDTELGPCPQCGASEGELFLVRSILRYAVQCRQCGWFTKPGLSEKDALASWAEKPPAADEPGH